MSLKQLKAKLMEDDVFSTYRDIARTISKRINTQQVKAEVKMLHSSERSARQLKGKAPSNSVLYAAEATELATRSRLTEMKLAIVEEIDLLERAIAAVTAHLRTSYVSYFESYRTEADKKLLMRTIMKNGYALVDELDSCQKQIDIVIKDIDQASYGLSRMVVLFKILHERKVL